jgi:hypothetical protein
MFVRQGQRRLAARSCRRWGRTFDRGRIDGVEWFRDATHLPTAVSHQAIQLDWFPSGGSTRESSLRVDWVRAHS